MPNSIHWPHPLESTGRGHRIGLNFDLSRGKLIEATMPSSARLPTGATNIEWENRDMAEKLDQTVFDSFCYWQGVPTLFRCPHDPDPANCDIGLIGVPHSSGNGTTERDQHLGPRALRDMSMGYRRCHAEYRIDPWNKCRINDLGDPPMPNAMVNDTTVKEIEAFFKKVDEAGCRPVSIGGDHSIPLPILRAIASPDSKINGGEPVAMVHFDAHLDTYPMDLLGVREHAGAI